MKVFTDQCNIAKKDLDVLKSKLDAKEHEKRVTMREDMLGYGDGDDDGSQE